MITCEPKVTEGVEPPNRKVKWSESDRSRLAILAEQRAIAMKALGEMYAPVDPLVARAKDASIKAQQYWEEMLFEVGHMTWLAPNKTNQTGAWLANVLGQKLGSAADVREPLVNMRRLVEGNMREAGIYAMMQKQQKFAAALKATGITFSPEDYRRFIEEGLTPQRLAVYGNTDAQQAALTTRFNKFKAEMLGRGLDEDQLRNLLDMAQGVSAQWDNVRAVALSTGMEVGDMFNIGYFPRQFTPEALRAMKAAGVIEATSPEAGAALLSKSRATWQYLVEDHKMASKMLGVEPEQLNHFIANPAEFAQFLSLRTTDDQLDLLVDSGVFSKVPMLTSEVGEFLTRKYKVPFASADMFISDPLAASNVMIEKLKAGAQESAIIKQLKTEGVLQGWAVPGELVKEMPEKYSKFVLANHLKNINLAAGSMYIHPDVAAHLTGVLKISQSPAEMSKAASILRWWKTTFSAQALGNPLTAVPYLTKQLLSNMSSTLGRGAGLTDFAASLIDVINVSTRGLDVLDNVKPFRVLDGKTVTQQEFVARTLRMFSHNILPGVDVTGTGAKMFDWKQLDPRYVRAQFERIRASGQNGVGGYLSEINAVLKEKSDALFMPTLRMASIIDMAGQLAVARGRTQQAYGGVKSLIKDADQLITGWNYGKLDKWEDVTKEVKRAFPMFDDTGSLTEAITLVAPFQTWAMHNLPLQLQDMMRQPTKWYNYARLHAIWNDEQTGDDPILEGEMQGWERDKYGLVLRHDPATKQSVMLFTQDFDPRWGALTWLARLSNDKSMQDIRDDVRGRGTQSLVNDMISKSYFAGAYKAVSGIDPLTGLKRDESPLAFEQFGNMPMPGWVASILSISPVLSSLDRLPVISGTRQVLDPRTQQVLQPAVDGWLGNQGTLRPKQLQGVEATLQVLGGSVRVVDRLNNMGLTWRDTQSTLRDLIAQQSQQQKNLAAGVQTGQVSTDSDTYRKRVAAINKMTDTILQLNTDLGRIEAWGKANNVPEPEVMQKLRDLNLAVNDLPMPGADYLRSQLDYALKNKIEEK